MPLLIFITLKIAKMPLNGLIQVRKKSFLIPNLGLILHRNQ
jgi:hypothetical protein